jgi:ubiquinone/menaquinone biosynthesis C-methylase UbiE
VINIVHGYEITVAFKTRLARLRSLKMEDEFSLEARFYDKIWGKYDYNSDVKFLDDLFKEHRCRSIIDVGCGTGNHALRLSKLGYEVVGVDISPTMLRIAKEKGKEAKVRFIQGDMKKLEKIIPENRRFDAAICLGQAFSSMITNMDVHAFFHGIHKILRKNGLFVFGARNTKMIKEEYLNTIRLDHTLVEKRLQLLVLVYNTRDSRNRNVIVWRPIFLMKENDKVDFQIREHKLRWNYYSELKKMLTEDNFTLLATYSGNTKEKFDENEHANMWFVTTAK